MSVDTSDTSSIAPYEEPPPLGRPTNPRRTLRDRMLDKGSGLVYWFGSSRHSLWLPLLPLAVGLVILSQKPVLLSEPPAVDLHLRSERSIPEDVPADGVKIDPQDVVWRFRYAPTGTEFRAGIPYWVFRVMPEIFPEVFQGQGYAIFGFGEDDHRYYKSRAVPRGLVLTDTELNFPLFKIGARLKRVAINCSGCHRGEYQGRDGQVHYVDGMPNHTANLQGFKRFFNWAFQEDRFSGERLVEEVNRALERDGKPPLTLREELVYRGLAVALKQATQENVTAWMDRRADNGPGRIDPFNAVKFELIRVPDDSSASQVDFPSIWNQASELPRGQILRNWHHYDGNTQSSQARNRGSVLGVGGISLSVNKVSIDAIGRWLDDDLGPPAWPFSPPDPAEVQKGRALFTQHCAKCHGLYDAKTRSVTQVEGSQYMQRVKPGTDPERSKAFLKGTADALNNFGERRQLWERDAFRSTEEGLYLCGPLDGIWARAPYLHTGAVPTLADLLKPPAPTGAKAAAPSPAEAQKYRPARFYRGSRRYDEKNMGWLYTEPMDDGRALFEYRTLDSVDQPIPGNSNFGHLYGTELSTPDKDALLAYLKTL